MSPSRLGPVEVVITVSVRHKWLVLALAALLTVIGWRAWRDMRLDAIPDLSDVQVIVTTEYEGQNPEIVDTQVTYPLARALLAVPGAAHVRGISMFEQSFVYVLFEDGTDIYWARARVLEYLASARQRLPKGVEPRLGPDATGVGWVLQYALVDASPPDRSHDLAELRTLQDHYLRLPLESVPGVAEVASIGGYVKQYQVLVDPERLSSSGISIHDVRAALESNNNDFGGSVVEQSEREYMVRSRGYLRGLEDLGKIPVFRRNLREAHESSGTAVALADVAALRAGSEPRRGIGDLDGKGEAVGGVVVARFGENANRVIADVKRKLGELAPGLPEGVSVRITYDRSAVIGRAVDTLTQAVLEELLVIGLICFVFLLHVRSVLVAVVALPIGLLASVLLMNTLGINANIMSLGGLALALGVMVDSAIVMIENAHQRLAEAGGRRPRAEVVLDAAREVGPTIFFSLLVIAVSFLPIFVIGDEAGRMFTPLAFTKTFAITAGAVLGVTVVPALMVLAIRGRIPRHDKNPLNRLFEALYAPVLRVVLRHPVLTLLCASLLGASTLYPLSRIGSEFMPRLDEGDLLYMPTTAPSISVSKSQELLQDVDRLIAQAPEVRAVHGKIGRAETATDPAPLSMIETMVRLETDRSAWRRRTLQRFFSEWPGVLRTPLSWIWPLERPITMAELKGGWDTPDGEHHAGLDEIVRMPGLTNAWPYPIESRLAMLATGIKTPVGIKLFGPDLAELTRLAEATVAAVSTVPGTASAYAEDTSGGYYLDVDVNRDQLVLSSLALSDVHDAVRSAIGGANVSVMVEGLARFSINVRYARDLRDDPFALGEVLVRTPSGAQVPLGRLAKISIAPGPAMIRSEDAQTTAWVYVDVAGRDLGGYVEEAKRVVASKVPVPPGYSRTWAGTFEYLEKATERLWTVVPVAFALMIVLLYLATRSWFRVGVVLLSVPFSLIGAFWFLWALGYDMSIAVWVGIIALLGIDAETGQLMLLYLDSSYGRAQREGRMQNEHDLRAAIHDGAVKRLRPKAMTVATDMLGLLPLLWATNTGADITRRLVAPLIGGIAVSFAMELLVYPAIYWLTKRRGLPAGP